MFMASSSHGHNMIRIGIVEDNEIVREGLVEVIKTHSDFVLSATFCSVADVRAFSNWNAIDILLTDIGLPDGSGLDVLKLVGECSPSTRLMVLTVFEDPHIIRSAILAGAEGYVLKTASAAMIIRAVHDVLTGGFATSPIVGRAMADELRRLSGYNMLATRLTPRELQILERMAEGARYREIADEMFISLETVRTHVRNIYDKLHVRSKRGVVALFKRSLW